MRDLAGKRAVVTGAARGIGAGIVDRLASLGVTVLAVDVDGSALRARHERDARVTCLVGDITTSEQLADAVLEEGPPPELIVNNVGVDTPGDFLATPEKDWDDAVAVNLRGPWFFTRRLATALIEARQPGSIVFISSLHDHRIRRHPHYSASKAAVAMLVSELARELGPHAVRVNAVSPGVVVSGSVRAPKSKADETRIRRIVPLGRIGTPADVAAVVAVLLSEETAGYVSGANVAVDGGLDAYSWSVEE